jgi:hypothetical protein
VQLHDSRYVCANCGAILDIALTDDPQATIHGASGQPNVRTLMLDGKQIHACQIDEHRRAANSAAATHH